MLQEVIVKTNSYVYKSIDQHMTITYFSDLCETRKMMLGIGVRVATHLIQEKVVYDCYREIMFKYCFESMGVSMKEFEAGLYEKKENLDYNEKETQKAF